jgi:hypothetical protein
LHNKPIGCGASGAYAEGHNDEEEVSDIKMLQRNINNKNEAFLFHLLTNEVYFKTFLNS